MRDQQNHFGRLNGQMVDVPGGEFIMGSNDYYPEERPARLVVVKPFLIDKFAVTNRDFKRFVDDTGHVTTAEIAPTLEEYAEADPAMLKPGSAVFVSPRQQRKPYNALGWWSYIFDACWRAPEGHGSSIVDRMDHPVVHVSFQDASAYASWCGKVLPTEAEWEFAARGGLIGAPFAWGNELMPDGRAMANYWIGQFPFRRFSPPGHYLTTPVGSYPPNGLGLYDMVGNVWEWTSDDFAIPASVRRSCCEIHNLKSHIRSAKVIKGGSYLCAENYCKRYRPAARHPQDSRTTTGHLGFRCILR